MEEHEPPRTLVKRLIDTALLPLQTSLQAATSKSAQKAYLGTFLLASTSVVLLVASSLAYILFYYSYVPQVGIERVIHLQFGDGHPYGITSLASTLTSQQPYDISLILHLPRSPTNLKAGNFMIDLTLVSPTLTTSVTSPPSEYLPSSIRASPSTGINSSSTVLAQSRRPAILTYQSPLIDTATTLSSLLWYITGLKKQSEVLRISMFEGVEFAKGRRNIADQARVTIEVDSGNGKKMDFYEVELNIHARFGGLRWLMYNHRLFSFLVFVGGFYVTCSSSAFVAFLALSVYVQLAALPNEQKQEQSQKAIKAEPGTDGETAPTSNLTFNPLSTADLSDTNRSFPTFAGHQPLKFLRGQNGVKPEQEADEKKFKAEEGFDEDIAGSTSIQPLAFLADDEDEEDDEAILSWRDSGLGTGIDEERSGRARKRSDHQKKKS